MKLMHDRRHLRDSSAFCAVNAKNVRQRRRKAVKIDHVAESDLTMLLSNSRFQSALDQGATIHASLDRMLETTQFVCEV